MHVLLGLRMHPLLRTTHTDHLSTTVVAKHLSPWCPYLQINTSGL